jgi:sugar/nucleoside kinase (ribokinase family)/sugar phosphate isomerase/epimerase
MMCAVVVDNDRSIMRKYTRLALCLLTVTSWSTVPVAANILVVGSINADTFLPVSRLPCEGENLTLLPGKQPVVDVPGGKGCTQAVAASKLYQAGTVSFVGQFGNDAAASTLKQALTDAHVDLVHSGSHKDLPSGRGYVFLSESGAVSAVVSGGSNTGGWKTWEHAWEGYSKNPENIVLEGTLDVLMQDCKCIMLQREVPEYVNMLVASYAKRHGNILVLQDVGGEDRPMDSAAMKCCDYLMPNESELQRLVRSFGVPVESSKADPSNTDTSTIVEMVQVLQKHGARNVLVTRGSRGSTLVTESGEVLHQPAFPASNVVDETGAGDCYRAGFAVALLEGKSLQKCMEFASAAGSCSVEVEGAVPSTPTRDDVEERSPIMTESSPDIVLKIPRGDGLNVNHVPRGGEADFPFLIGSRLNSMKDRPELWNEPLQDPRDWVTRQATIQGLTCVDFNYPQHFHTWTSQEAKAALDEAGLVAGAVCLRYPSKFARGAMNHPDPLLRQEAIELTKQAAQVALDLGCNEVVVWSAYDGYDYPFQVEYDTKWQEVIDAFRECCDAFPQIRFSLEYKPTDENTRFFTVPSTGAALLLVHEIDRPNMGLTLDVGHMLMSGENPGQSIAMVGRARKLFGIQLNDGFTRLAAEDGLMFGSVHPTMALEIMYQLRKISFDGHVYFDTFPQRSDPVKEAEYNIRKVKAFWSASGAVDRKRLQQIMDEHDAVGALELTDEAFRQL